MESKDLLEHGIRSVFLSQFTPEDKALALFSNLSDTVYSCGAPPSVPRKVTWFDRVKGWWGDWCFWWHTRPGGKHEDYLDY